MKKKFRNKFINNLVDEYKWIDNEFINEKRVSVVDILDLDEDSISYKLKEIDIDYEIITINYDDVMANQIKNILDVLLEKKPDKKILLIINYVDLKNIYNNLNDILSLYKDSNFKVENKYFSNSIIMIISNSINKNFQEIISLREDKINLANKLINSYQKEEYFLKTISNNLNKEERIKKNHLKELMELRKEKIELSKVLLNSYQKEEYLLNSYDKLLKQFNIINKKYFSLSNSKLGKLTIWYWKERKKRR
ncbi:hypothetical protein PMY56_16580 [Clostridium tertium]|uniref:hypothetical protein n=3 Tax=Clostridium tertium TaxID=1559 RepID=UPI0023314D99|nr:hypothetical protein [Clostridium tertium]MDB1921591.1 hypothetical protein [Clostridium tertium]MDB1927750.1 hypothetical protein [Clostridium tertium]